MNIRTALNLTPCAATCFVRHELADELNPFSLEVFAQHIVLRGVEKVEDLRHDYALGCPDKVVSRRRLGCRLLSAGGCCRISRSGSGCDWCFRCGGVLSFVGRGISTGASDLGFLMPSEAKSSVMPRFSIAVLPKDSGENVAAIVSGTRRMRKVRTFPGGEAGQRMAAFRGGTARRVGAEDEKDQGHQTEQDSRNRHIDPEASVRGGSSPFR
jgi:hypothetical protein